MADSRVKPCSVVLHIGEAEDYFRKSRKLFEIQKVIKTEPYDEITVPEVSVNQEFPPEAKRPCLDHCDDKSLYRDCITKQEPQDEVNMTSENFVMSEFISIKGEPVDEINFQSESENPSCMPDEENMLATLSHTSLSNRPSTSLSKTTQCLPSIASTSSGTDSVDLIKCIPHIKITNSETNTNQRHEYVPPHVQALQFLIQFFNVNKSYQFEMNLKSIKNLSSMEALEDLRRQTFCEKKLSRMLLRCKYCFANFFNHPSFFKHYKTIHKLTFNCLKCKIKVKDLASHISSHHNFSFHANNLELHWFPQIFDNLVLTLFQCLYCKMSAENYYHFCYHVNSCHHVCKICSENFNTDLELLAHNDQHSSGQVYYFKCDGCSLKLVSFDRMSEHAQSCSSSFKQEIVMSPQINVQLHFECPFCLLSFLKKNNLCKHLLGHCIETCESCEKIFVPPQFVGIEKIKDLMCITCNLKLNASANFELKTCDISMSEVSEELSNSFKKLNDTSCADLAFEIARNNNTPLTHKIKLDIFKGVELKFTTLDMECIRETRIKNNPAGLLYLCLICNNSQLKYGEIDTHLVQCFSLVKLKCKTCNFITDCVETFSDHLNANEAFNVKTSGYYFKAILGEVIYVKMFEKIVRCLRCLFCKVELGDVPSLLNHVVSTHLNCKYCGITSLNVQEYLGHNTKQNLKHDDYFECTTCQTILNCKILATGHAVKCYLSSKTSTMFQKNGEPSRCLPLNIYYCPYCPESFTREINLVVHLPTHNRVQKCSDCERQFLPKDIQSYKVSAGKCFICHLKCKKITLAPVISTTQ